MVEHILTSYFTEMHVSSRPSAIEDVCEVVKGNFNENHRKVCGDCFNNQSLE